MNILSVLENKICYFCGMPCYGKIALCDSCQSRLFRIHEDFESRCSRCHFPLFSAHPDHCPFCARISSEIDEFISLSYYCQQNKELIIRYKSGADLSLSHFFAERLNQVIESMKLEGYLLIPMPPRKGKIRKTGWDQIDLICNILKRKYKIPVWKCLKRHDALPQKTLDYGKRISHMNKVLSFKRTKKELTEFEHVILLDDIFTSGASVSAASGLLKQEFNINLHVLVLSMVL